MSADDKFFLKKRYLFWCFAIISAIFVFYKIKDVLLPFYIAFFVTILFSGIVDWFEKKIKIPRILTSALITIAIYGVIIYISLLFLPILYTKATNSYNIVKNTDNNFLSNMINVFNTRIQSIPSFSAIKIEQIISWAEDNVLQEISTFMKKGFFNLFHSLTSLVSVVVLLALSPIVMFMMLKDMPIIKKKFFTILPKQWQHDAHVLFSNMHESVFKFLEGQTLASFILGLIYSVLLYFLKIDNFMLLGMMIGFSAFIPYVGFYSSVAITLFATYSQFHNINIVLITFALLMAGQVIDSGFITPKLVGNKLGVHPLWIVFGVLVSVPLFGVLGVLLALPMVGIMSVLIKFVVKKYKDSSYYKE